MPHRLISSAVGDERLSLALEWLRSKAPHAPLLVVASTLEAANSVLRRMATEKRAVFAWHRESLGSLAGKLAALPLAHQGLSPAGTLALEAVNVRVVFELHALGELGRFERVAERPGLVRALTQTLAELGMAGVDPTSAGLEPALARVYVVYREALRRMGLADRARVFAEAIRVVNEQQHHPLVGVPTLFWDVRVSSCRERDIVAALARKTSDCLATVPSLDTWSLESLRDALCVSPEPVRSESGHDKPSSALRRLQTQLFEPPTQTGALGDELIVLSAPGEARECVEIARRVLKEAERGVRFEQMAILLRSPELYRAHLVDALRRACVPAYFSRGTTRPEPTGRALLALLTCAAEDLSARRFAEYLSLGLVPQPIPSGEPPPAQDRAERWLPPDDDLISLGPQAALVAAAGNEADFDREISNESHATTRGSMSAGTLIAPRHWERLLVDAAVLGGRDRWRRRLDGLEQELAQKLRTPEASDDDASWAAIDRDLQALRALCAYALPLVEELAALPKQANWGDWIDALSALATRAIADPAPVLQGLAELSPMAPVGPIEIAEVRLVLERRFGDQLITPQATPEGKLFVAAIDEARGLVFDLVFVPGLAEKIFPRRLTEDPLLLDAARQRISSQLATAEDRAAGERSLLQIAIGAARQRLVISYPRFATDRARPRVPSFYGLEVLRAAEGRLPGFDELARRAIGAAPARMGWPAPQHTRDAIDATEYDLVVLERLLAGTKSETEGAAHYLLAANPHLARALRFRARRWHKNWHSVDGLVHPNEPARRALLLHALAAREYSATALEKYAVCPYRFYLSAIVGLRTRDEAEPIELLDGATRGLLVHEVLRTFLSELRAAGSLPIVATTLEQARARLDRVLDETAERYRDQLAPAIARVWEDGVAEIQADLREWLLRSADEPQWVPIHFELGFGLRRIDSDPASLPEPVALDCGIRLRGAIDLVERRAEELRATDYKTGAVPAARTRVVAGGRSLQAVLYALALQKLFPDSQVAGGRAYYCSSRAGFGVFETPLDERAKQAATLVAKTIDEAIDQGFLPAAPDKNACSRCEFLSVCGPYEEQRVARKDQQRLAALTLLRRQA